MLHVGALSRMSSGGVQDLHWCLQVACPMLKRVALERVRCRARCDTGAEIQRISSLGIMLMGPQVWACGCTGIAHTEGTTGAASKHVSLRLRLT